MNGFELRKQQKRKDIMNAAFTLFNKEGIKKVKISDIARFAGVSQVTIYNHFTSKEELVRAVMKEYMHQQFQIFKESVEEERTFPELVELIVFEKHKAVQSLDPSLLQEMLTADEELKEYVDHFYRTQTLPLFVQLLERAREHGEINALLSMESIMFYLNALKTEVQRIPAKTWSERKDFLDDVLQLFFYGLSGGPSSDRNESE
ncbi:TetR/AcrR family transcriptional regulator [Pseudalkalibacillus hwajinpoensis]|uniref:TetR/AcrR family transcriptional regulator n=1 Tax=Guptibacillus hwajinpoensis TaxID=208199 RepID=UPI001CD46FF2|nr:TetR/AcrR family transcriptional regulator [Pseudalkalibacillus hwajinpoensis]MCA0991782.1 TetR/AcrR family transcriptional regulator [Pseudalkalibacillus hwajinpoensis]